MAIPLVAALILVGETVLIIFLLVQADSVAALTLVGQCLSIRRTIPATVRLGELCDSIHILSRWISVEEVIVPLGFEYIISAEKRVCPSLALL